MHTVFIMGAGASVEAGAPTMMGFLPTANKLQRQFAYGLDAGCVQDVLNAAYIDLKPVLVKSNLDFKNIEELFSAIDMGCLINCFGSKSPDGIESLRRSIVTFIYRTIEETIKIPISNDGVAGLPVGYSYLAKMVADHLKESVRLGVNDITFLSFNYDTCLEYSLVRSGVGIDYGLKEGFYNKNEEGFGLRVPVLKLHGSVNWSSCSVCNEIVPIEIDPYRNVNFLDVFDLSGQKAKLSYNLFRPGRNHHCGAPLDGLPYIVPPTWNKASSAKHGLEDVWKRAAKELGRAENIVFIGYSLPETDMFFRYLFALGVDSDVHLEKVHVINGPEGGYTKARFEKLLGPSTRDGFNFHEIKFSEAKTILKKVLDE